MTTKAPMTPLEREQRIQNLIKYIDELKMARSQMAAQMASAEDELTRLQNVKG